LIGLCESCNRPFETDGFIHRCWTCINIPRGYRFDDEAAYIQQMISHGIDASKIECALSTTQSLYLIGSCGTGKTRIAFTVAKAAHETKKTVRTLTSHTKSFGTLAIEQNGYDIKPWKKKDTLDALKRCDCLLIDDLGKANAKDWYWSLIYDILDARASNDKQTIITANNHIMDTAIEHFKASLVRRIEEFYCIVKF